MPATPGLDTTAASSDLISEPEIVGNDKVLSTFADREITIEKAKQMMERTGALKERENEGGGFFFDTQFVEDLQTDVVFGHLAKYKDKNQV